MGHRLATRIDGEFFVEHIVTTEVRGSRNALNCTASARKMSTMARENAGRNLFPSVRS